jgi:hypothetical protein
MSSNGCDSGTAMGADDTVRARGIAAQLLALRHDVPSPEQPAPRRELRAPAKQSGKTIDYPRLQQHARWFDGLLKIYSAVAAAVAEELREELAVDDPLVRGLYTAHRLVLQHPVAAKALFAGIVAEGRAFARTERGAQLRAGLARSARMRRGALLWRSLTLGMLDPMDPAALPSTYVDTLLRALDGEALERLLGRLQQVGSP